MAPRERYALIDYQGLKDLLNFKTMQDLANAYRGWIEEAVNGRAYFRDRKWTESVAVGNEIFVKATKERFGVIEGENSSLRVENTYFWYNIPSILNA